MAVGLGKIETSVYILWLQCSFRIAGSLVSVCVSFEVSFSLFFKDF